MQPISLFVEPSRFELFCPFCGKEIFHNFKSSNFDYLAEDIDDQCPHVTFAYRIESNPEGDDDFDMSRFTYSTAPFAKEYLELAGLKGEQIGQFLEPVGSGGVSFSLDVIDKFFELRQFGEHSMVFYIRTCIDDGIFTDIYSEKYTLVIGICNRYDSFSIL
jgi:hypothetical protein